MKTPQLRLIETPAPDLAKSVAPPIPVESHLVAPAGKQICLYVPQPTF